MKKTWKDVRYGDTVWVVHKLILALNTSALIRLERWVCTPMKVASSMENVQLGKDFASVLLQGKHYEATIVLGKNHPAYDGYLGQYTIGGYDNSVTKSSRSGDIKSSYDMYSAGFRHANIYLDYDEAMTDLIDANHQLFEEYTDFILDKFGEDPIIEELINKKEVV